MRYITIEREYGSGGTKIARGLSKACNIPCYGQEILECAAKKLNMTADDIRNHEEKSTNSLVYSLYMLSQVQNSSSNMLSKEGKIFVEELNAIRDFARQGSAIFLGHCAIEALKEYDDVVQVFIYSDAETKQKRIMEDYGIKVEKINFTERRNNKRRSNYYFANTQKKWDDFRNYDIVLDSSRLGINGCVDVLKGLIK